MDHYLFSVRSATQAQRASRVLNSGGIHASVQRLPVEFARQGCTYAAVSYTHLDAELRRGA